MCSFAADPYQYRIGKCDGMLRLTFVLIVFVGCSVRAATDERHEIYRNRDAWDDGNSGETGRTWKMSKKGFGYFIIGLIVKALILIKLALGKLAVLGNVSIILSKLSLVTVLFLAFGKYFAGLSKILKTKPTTYEGQPAYHYPGVITDHVPYGTGRGMRTNGGFRR